MEQELERLYEQTGEKSVLPGRAPRYIEYNGERKELTAEEYVDFATLRGKTAYQILTSLTGSDAYKNASDEAKAEMVKDAYTYSDQNAKAAVSDYQPSAWVLKANATKKGGVSTGEYIAQYIQRKHHLDSEKNAVPSFSVNSLSPEAKKQYNERWATSYGETAARLEEIPGFRYLDELTKEKALSSAEDLAKESALAELSDGEYSVSTKWMNWATGGADYGVDETEAILFKVAYDMAESEKDENGKSIPGSKKENVLEAVDDLMPGLTVQELEYLIANYWTPEDETLKELKENDFIS